MLLRTSPESATDVVADLKNLSADDARRLIGVMSVAFGVAQLLAPQAISRLFGVPPKRKPTAGSGEAETPPLPVLAVRRSPELVYYQRLFAVRNIQLGLEALDPDPAHGERALTSSASVLAMDIPVTLWAAARGHIGRRGAVALLSVLGGYAWLNVRARA